MDILSSCNRAIKEVFDTQVADLYVGGEDPFDHSTDIAAACLYCQGDIPDWNLISAEDWSEVGLRASEYSGSTMYIEPIHAGILAFYVG
jgi:hypothetical protein